MRFVTTANTASTSTSGSKTCEWSTAKYQATQPAQPATARPKASARVVDEALAPTGTSYGPDFCCYLRSSANASPT